MPIIATAALVAAWSFGYGAATKVNNPLVGYAIWVLTTIALTLSVSGAWLALGGK